MKIKSIQLYNFRQYKKTKIEFSTDPEKKITLILGNNTSGKTTLVKAFLWCLYRTNLFVDKILLNRDVQENMNTETNESAKVVLELEHNDASYTITTKESYYKKRDGDIGIVNKAETTILKVDNSGSFVVPFDKVEEEINSILSSDLKDYFFFDGENNSIDSVGSKRNLTEAVSDLMGLKRLELLKDYYDPKKTDSVTNKFRSKLVSTDITTLEKLNELLEKAQENLNNEQNRLNNKEDGIYAIIEKLKNQYEEKEELISQNSDVKEFQDKKKELNGKINNSRIKRDDDYLALISSLNNSNVLLKLLFATSFKKNDLSNKLSKSSFNSDTSLTHISEEVIDQLISRGYCLCGKKIENGDEAYKHLLEAKEHMEPRDYGKYASDFVDYEEGNFNRAQSYVNDMVGHCSSIIDVIEKIDSYKLQLKAVEEKLQNRIDVGELQKDASSIKEQMNRKEGERDYIVNTSIPKYQKEINDYTIQIGRLTANTGKNDFVNMCINYCEYIFKRANNKITSSKTEIKNKLQELVSEIFNSMYHGNRCIVIDDNFKADAKLIGNKDLDKSKGLETVKNFAFVTGLMKLVKDKISDDEFDDGVRDENYPLVLDAPFSNTDDIHIKNICKALPNYCNQIIIVVMEKDFKSAKKEIDNQIGKFYRIEKNNNSETDSVILEEK